MNESEVAEDCGPAVRRRDRGLIAIGLWKLVEAVFFFLVGLGVIHFLDLHRDLGDAVTQLAERLHMNIGGQMMTWVLSHVDDVTAHRLKQIGAWTFVLAGVRVAEGMGLVMEKAWAEYLTVGVTVSFLPWELYEICKRPNLLRVGLLITNLIVLAYVVWVLRRNRTRLAGARSAK